MKRVSVSIVGIIAGLIFWILFADSTRASFNAQRIAQNSEPGPTHTAITHTLTHTLTATPAPPTATPFQPNTFTPTPTITPSPTASATFTPASATSTWA